MNAQLAWRARKAELASGDADLRRGALIVANSTLWKDDGDTMTLSVRHISSMRETHLKYLVNVVFSCFVDPNLHCTERKF